jgi:[acyl-carrier-protein] S-malonyltransferase
VIAFLFPGQNSQKVGMGQALATQYAEAAAAFAQADAAYAADPGEALPEALRGRSLSSLCFEGPEDVLAMTEVTQPALVATSVAACRALASHGVQPSFVAGHSLGEYSAHVAAGTIDFGDAVRIVRRRGRYMQEAVPLGTGAMAAILGADLATVEQACRESSQGEVVSPANINGRGQIVIAGATAAVHRAAERAKALGAKRAIMLNVSAPFHCAMMQPAEDRLAPELRALAVANPRVPVVANVDAEPKRDGAAAIEALVRQVSSPVQWESVILRLASEGVTTYVEVGSGSVLTSLVRKIHADARAVSFGAPDDLDAVLTACSISTAK